MKKIFQLNIVLLVILLFGCGNNEKNQPLIIGTSADYPPFEFKQGEIFKGLDIDLANLVAKELHRKIEFKNLSHDKLFAELNSKHIDLAISSISFTKEREKNFDLSNPYYFSDIALIFKKDHPIQSIAELSHKKVGVQLGTTMEGWGRELFKDIQLITMDFNNQLIESIKSGQIDTVIIEYIQAKEFCNKNKDLGYLVASKANHGYVIVMKKGSKLLQPVNSALEHIKSKGYFTLLEKQWLEVIIEADPNDVS